MRREIRIWRDVKEELGKRSFSEAPGLFGVALALRQRVRQSSGLRLGSLVVWEGCAEAFARGEGKERTRDAGIRECVG